MRRLLLGLVLLLCALPAWSQTATVSGNLKTVGVTNATTPGTKVTFTLQNYASNIPRVSGSYVVAQASYNFTPDANGAISGSVIRNDQITPAGTYYQVCIYDAGRQFRCANYNIAAASFDLNSAAPITTSPVVTPPTGDTTYLRTDGGNQMSGNIIPNTTDTRTIGNSSARFDATLDDVVAGKLNNILFVDGVKYATIQAAHDALPSTGGTIKLPQGDHPFSTPLTITKNVVIEGHGDKWASASGATTLRWTGGASVPITVDADTVVFRGFNLDNTGTATIGIEWTAGRDYLLLDHVSMKPQVAFSTAGIRATAGAGVHAWFKMQGCWVQEAAPIQLDLDGTNLFVSEFSTFFLQNGTSRTNIRVGQTSAVTSFYFLGGSDSENYDGGSPLGIDLVNVTQANIRNAYFETLTANGLDIRVGTNVATFTADGNYFQGNSATNYAILLNGGTDLQIAQNTFNNYLTFAVNRVGGLPFAYNNRALGTTPGIIGLGMSGLVPSSDQASLGDSINRFVANLYEARFYRSAGDNTFADIRGDGTNALVIAGKSDGSGIVRSGATSSWEFYQISKYKDVATVSGGIPAEYAQVNLTAQGAAIGATTLYAVPAAGAGQYRVCFNMKVTQAATTSSVLGGTNGFQLVYTDQDDSVVVTTVAGLTFNSTVVNLALNTTQAQMNGCLFVNAKASTNIQYQVDYTSVGATPMQYNLHIRLEAM